MQENTVSSPSLENPFSVFDWAVEFYHNNGIIFAIVAFNVLWAIVSKSTMGEFYKALWGALKQASNALWQFITGSSRAMNLVKAMDDLKLSMNEKIQDQRTYYENMMSAVKDEQTRERENCDSQIHELRDLVNKQQNQITEQQKEINTLKQQEKFLSVDVATLKEQLKASQEAAQKFYRKSGSSVKPKD